MPILEIDGIGKVEVGDGFLSLNPQQQAAEVDFMAQSLKPQVAAPAAAPAGAERFANPDPEMGFGAVKDIKEGAARVAKGLSSERIQEGANSVIPMAPVDVAAGLFQIGSAPFMAAGRAFGQAMEKATGGAITAQQAETALMALAPARGGALNLKSGAVPEAVPVPAGAPAAAPQQSAVEQVLKRPDGSPAPAVAAGEPMRFRSSPYAAPAAPGMPRGPEPPPAAAAVDAGPTTAAEFKASSRSFYKEAEDAGLLINPRSLETSVKELATELKKGGLDPTLHAEATAALKRLAEKRLEPVTLQDLDTLRQIALDAAASPKAGERRLAGMIKDKIDDFVLNLSDKDVISSVGKPEEAVAALTKAREFWSKSAKLDKVADLVDRAQTSASGFSGSGFENALRTEFRALAKNKSAMRTFTAQEQDAIKKVARGGALENTARNVGKLAPTGIVSGALGGGAGAALGGMIGMPVAGAVAVGGLGFAGRRLATVLTKRNIANLEKAIITGGPTKAAVASLERSKALLGALEQSAAATSAAGNTKAPPGN